MLFKTIHESTMSWNGKMMKLWQSKCKCQEMHFHTCGQSVSEHQKKLDIEVSCQKCLEMARA